MTPDVAASFSWCPPTFSPSAIEQSEAVCPVCPMMSVTVVARAAVPKPTVFDFEVNSG